MQLHFSFFLVIVSCCFFLVWRQDAFLGCSGVFFFFFSYFKGSILSLKQTVLEGPGKQFYLKI